MHLHTTWFYSYTSRHCVIGLLYVFEFLALFFANVPCLYTWSFVLLYYIIICLIKIVIQCWLLYQYFWHFYKLCLLFTYHFQYSKTCTIKPTGYGTMKKGQIGQWACLFRFLFWPEVKKKIETGCSYYCF